MSGGVDSTVAAWLLKQKGHDVVGLHLHLPAGKAEGVEAVCRQIGVPLHVEDCRERFERTVIADFCEEYRRGRTPNPCVLCNHRIKFAVLLETADRLNAQGIATGHYARVEFDAGRGRYLLKRGEDLRKDQSYMLHRLTQEQLAPVIFPLGDRRKTETRKLARDLGLPVHDRPGSQEACFVPGNDTAAFLTERLGDRMRPGPIVDTRGRVVGRHHGIHRFTVGQRRGLGIAAGEPLYVVRIEADANRLVVGARAESCGTRARVSRVNWVALDSPADPFRAEVKIRYQHPAAPATVEPLPESGAAIEFDEPQHAITPGQSAVLYDGDLVLGGGIIEAQEHP